MAANRGNRRPAVVTIPVYLEAVERMHAITAVDMARILGVNVSAVRRWRRGQQVPDWRRLRQMVTRWGGDAELLALGAALQRYARETGVTLEDAVRLVRSGRRTAPARPKVRRSVPRNQLSLPIG